jgi:hypothetical protein
MSLNLGPRTLCVICQVRLAEPMTYVCGDEKCFEIFMDYQSKGKLKELLDISEEQEKEKEEKE